MKSTFVLVLVLSIGRFALAQKTLDPVKVETLTKTSSAWDGTPYKAYPSGQPEITVLKITIAPHSVLNWHTHPMPIAGYVVSGELTVEKKDGEKKHFVAGQIVTETVNSIHRGITGDEPVVLIAFYAGTPKMPLSQETH